MPSEMTGSGVAVDGSFEVETPWWWSFFVVVPDLKKKNMIESTFWQRLSGQKTVVSAVPTTVGGGGNREYMFFKNGGSVKGFIIWKDRYDFKMKLLCVFVLFMLDRQKYP